MRVLIAIVAACAALGAQADSISRVNATVRVEAGQTVDDVSTVNGAIRVDDDARADDIETVNGSITVGRNAQIGSAQTVNGRISMGAGARARDVSTVNGSLQLSENVEVQGGVNAVNGAVQLAAQTHVAENVENVNGKIELARARVDGALRTTNGDINVGPGSHVAGGIHVEKTNHRNARKPHRPQIVIGPDAVVEGTLRFEREVDLYVSDRAKIGPVQGAQPIRFSGDEPTRTERAAAPPVER